MAGMKNPNLNTMSRTFTNYNFIAVAITTTESRTLKDKNKLDLIGNRDPMEYKLLKTQCT